MEVPGLGMSIERENDNLMDSKPRFYRLCIIFGSILLLLMAGFHGSGLGFVSDAIKESDASGFLKDIVPVLFLHPSIHLTGLAVLGLLPLFMNQEGRKVLWVLTVLILIDSGLAFFLGAILPGILLTIAAITFLFAGVLIQPKSE
ncbi:MAG: hypothetical protein AAF655_11285 [Bacteroidota bacterium]